MRHFLACLLTLPLLGLAGQGTTRRPGGKPYLVDLRRRAQHGDAKAQFDLGVSCRFGLGVPQSDAEAVAWYRKAAAQGYAKAQYNLGVCCDLGRGLPKDPVQAAGWYRQAAEQGLAKAQYNLGVDCKYGQGVPKDPVEACAWLDLADEGGVAAAAASRQGVAAELSPADLAKARTRQRELQAGIQARVLQAQRKARRGKRPGP